MNIKKFAPYIGAAVVAIVAIVAVISAVGSFDGTPAAWDQLSVSVGQVESASKVTEDTAVQNKDYTACVVSKSATGLIHGVGESILAAKEGKCRIPDVSVDASACVAFKPVAEVAAPPAEVPAVIPVPVVVPVAAPVTPALAETPVAAPVTPVEVAPVAPAVVAPVAPDMQALVKAATAPVVVLAQGLVTKVDADPNTKAWAAGVISWLDSGVPSVVALIEAPTNGKVTFVGQDIAGCTP